jgi:hypothetical protein
VFDIADIDRPLIVQLWSERRRQIILQGNFDFREKILREQPNTETVINGDD